MYIKFENREDGRRFTFFQKEREVNGSKVQSTDKCVFGTLSEGVKTGENNGKPIYENDYWSVTFCGKAYAEALALKDFDKISVVEMNVRNVYSKNTKKSYPQITVYDFDVVSVSNVNEAGDDGFIPVPTGDEDELPYK